MRVILHPLSLAAEHWATICAHLSAELPNEGCGLLAGHAGRTYQIYLITNIRRSPTRYEMEPGELVRAIGDMEANDWDLIGIFHSHPMGSPVPSPTDVAEAYYPDSAYVICSPVNGQWRARAFEIRAGQTQEIPFQIEPSTLS